MLKAFLSIFFCLLLCWGCSTAPRQELQRARMAVAEAESAEARTLAEEDFRKAETALKEGEALVRQGDYDRAREVLPKAMTYARDAVAQAQREKENRSRARLKEAARKAALERKKKASVTAPVRPAPEPAPSPAPAPQLAKPVPEPPPPPPATYPVREKENLWAIAGRQEVYGDPLLWPLLYQANRDQIKDPRQVYPGQVLSIPRSLPDQELEEAREKARRSEIFSPDPATGGTTLSPPG